MARRGYRTKGFGVKSLTDPGAVTNQTLFGIASLSKAFAATLLLAQIQEDKNLSLSTQVRTVLNDTEVFADYLRSHYATLEDLLAHIIGVPSNNNIRFNTNVTRKNLFKRLKYLSPKSGFRTSFTYSNLMYGLVTYISEVIGGWKTLWHTGTTYGYRAILSLFPDQDFGVFTAFTGDDPISDKFEYMYTADLMLGVDPWLNAKTICTFPEPWTSSVKSSSSPPRKDIKPNRDIDLYCGVYSNEAYGNIEIYKNKSENVLMGRYGFALVALYPKSIADYFYAEGREFIKRSKDF
ncbi:LOW QUALITY PROTEIN: GIGA6-like protein, partial [Mya arenaria]